MNAADLLKTLLSTGLTIKDAFAKAKANNATFDLADFLGGADFDAIKGVVAKALAALEPTDFQDGVERIRKKQVSIRGGRPLQSLSADELSQYSHLVEAELLLSSQWVLAELDGPKFWSWLVNDAVPVLTKVAPVVIPLLL